MSTTCDVHNAPRTARRPGSSTLAARKLVARSAHGRCMLNAGKLARAVVLSARFTSVLGFVSLMPRRTRAEFEAPAASGIMHGLDASGHAPVGNGAGVDVHATQRPHTSNNSRHDADSSIDTPLACMWHKDVRSEGCLWFLPCVLSRWLRLIQPPHEPCRAWLAPSTRTWT